MQPIAARCIVYMQAKAETVFACAFEPSPFYLSACHCSQSCLPQLLAKRQVVLGPFALLLGLLDSVTARVMLVLLLHPWKRGKYAHILSHQRQGPPLEQAPQPGRGAFACASGANFPD